MEQSINALFGSKTRVKLLNLFFNSPDQKFYVREISRTIDEQVNSVRRELTNLESVGVVKSSTEDRKIYYQANQRFKYYLPLRVIFAGVKIGDDISVDKKISDIDKWQSELSYIQNEVELLVLFGILADDPKSNIDMLLVGDNYGHKLSEWASKIENKEGRELNYMILSMEDFYYRYTTQDTFIKGLFKSNHKVIFDKEDLLKKL
jgi:probable transcriptional regulator